MLLLFLYACLPNQTLLTGVSVSPGNPEVFVKLCHQQDPTALDILKATGKTSCDQAGLILAGIDTIDFNSSPVEKINLNVLDSLSNIQSVSAYGKKIHSLTVLSGLVRLERLYMMMNEISDITPLSELHQLKYVRLDGNKITDITVLSKLKKLEKLGLDANQISDFRPIAKLPNLQDLNTNFNPVNLSKCPDGMEVNRDLRKYCKRMKKNGPDMQGAIDPK